MVVGEQVRVNIIVAIVLFVISAAGVDALVYRRAIDKSDANPLVSQRFSINNNGRNESAISSQVVNHVHHRHEQTVGNVHVQTNINITNLITILNTTAVNASQPADATMTTGKLCRSEKKTDDFIAKLLIAVRYVSSLRFHLIDIGDSFDSLIRRPSFIDLRTRIWSITPTDKRQTISKLICDAYRISLTHHTVWQSQRERDIRNELYSLMELIY